MDKPQIIVHTHKSLKYSVFDTKWLPRSAKIVILGSYPRGTGSLQIYELCQGDVKLINESEKPQALRCGTFGASSIYQRHLATGDFKGNLQIWDPENLKVPIYSVQAHEQIINAIDGVGGLGIGVGAPEIVTGSRDGLVKVWDPRQKDVPVATMEPEEGQKRDCWTVAFGNTYNVEERCVCAGYDNGDVKLFNLRTMSLQWETNIKNGVCCVEFDRKDILMNKLVVTSLESKFLVYDMRTQHPKKGFASLTEKAHKKATIWLARHLPQNRDVFMTTGGSGSLNLWKYNYPGKRSEKVEDGHSEGVMGTVTMLQNVTVSEQPLSGFDWSPDKEGLCACTSLDQTLRILIVTKLNRL
ncbi:dynein axonemal assembly factor 10 [Tachypleus tridentatus]|uniref:dynein axonemal assembly factor 10 n=1 Tax=Tachypleus tridentatus TaxID=6853 RepID=UPI003FD16B30